MLIIERDRDVRLLPFFEIQFGNYLIKSIEISELDTKIKIPFNTTASHLCSPMKWFSLDAVQCFMFEFFFPESQAIGVITVRSASFRRILYSWLNLGNGSLI